ncbi:MAG: hypothetical protein KKH94_06530 [Candidatus Omnitrophica bacterium]|nr:hypothetical protein [Candidatus Omnitrophota bacterium]
MKKSFLKKRGTGLAPKKKRDSFVDRIKSPIITKEILKTIQAINVKSIKAIADTITNVLDVQLVDADVKKVKAAIREIVDLFKASLK